MKSDRFVLSALILMLLLVFTGCVAEDSGPSVPTPIPTPTPPAFKMPSVPANTEESVEIYPSLTMEEQIATHSIAHLIQTVTNASPGEEYYEAVRAYIITFMAEGGVTLPEGFTVSASEGMPLYVDGDTVGENTPSAQFFATSFNAPEGDKHVLSTVLELESGYIVGSQFPRYIARAVLVAKSPKSTEYFLHDTDNDGSLDYAFRYYIPGVPYEESESECYVIHLNEWRFTAEPVSTEAWYKSKAEYERFAAEYSMRENVKKGINMTVLIPERYLKLSKNGKNGAVEIDLNTEELTVNYTCKNNTSTWELVLEGSDGILSGGFTADNMTYFDTSIGVMDLTGDGKKEILLSVVPFEAVSGGELHVFTQDNSALVEILTVCDGNPSQKQTQYAASYFNIPDSFTYSDGTAASGFSNMYTRAACVSASGINLLRITADKGQESAHTYLWWNGGTFEVVAQKVA